MKRIGLIIGFIFCAAISFGQQIHSGGINIATGFKLSDPQPIDDRYVVQDSLSLLSIPNIYTGLWAYSLGDSSVFVYDGIKWERIVDRELAMTLISTFPKDTNTLNEVLAKGGSITADREIVSTNMDLGFMNFDEFVINANSVTMDVDDSVLVKGNGKVVFAGNTTRFENTVTLANEMSYLNKPTLDSLTVPTWDDVKTGIENIIKNVNSFSDLLLLAAGPYPRFFLVLHDETNSNEPTMYYYYDNRIYWIPSQKIN